MSVTVDEHGIALANVDGVIGHLSHSDLVILKKFSETIPPDGIYVEVGSYLGCSSLWVSKHINPTGRVYAHDIWVENMKELNENGGPPIFVDNYFLKFHKNTKHVKNIYPVRGDSLYTLSIHDEESIDVAFIDGDHSYTGVQNDLKMTWPRMKEGGVVLMHDCANGSETKKGVIDFFTNLGLEEQLLGYTGTHMSSIIKCTSHL